MYRHRLSIPEFEQAIAWSHAERARTLHRLVRHGSGWLNRRLARRRRPGTPPADVA